MWKKCKIGLSRLQIGDSTGESDRFVLRRQRLACDGEQDHLENLLIILIFNFRSQSKKAISVPLPHVEVVAYHNFWLFIVLPNILIAALLARTPYFIVPRLFCLLVCIFVPNLSCTEFIIRRFLD